MILADAEPLKPIDHWVEKLGLQPHPEGGSYSETYRSRVRHVGHGEDFPVGRSVSTAIYYLLPAGEFSALHRIRSDEIWHFYYGRPLEIVAIDARGELETRKLGLQLELGEAPQHVVGAGAWFGASVTGETGYSLVGCTVSPGFDFRDFELGRRAELASLYPRHAQLIERYTRT